MGYFCGFVGKGYFDGFIGGYGEFWRRGVRV